MKITIFLFGSIMLSMVAYSQGNPLYGPEGNIFNRAHAADTIKGFGTVTIFPNSIIESAKTKDGRLMVKVLSDSTATTQVFWLSEDELYVVNDNRKAYCQIVLRFEEGRFAKISRTAKPKDRECW